MTIREPTLVLCVSEHVTSNEKGIYFISIAFEWEEPKVSTCKERKGKLHYKRMNLFGKGKNILLMTEGG